MNAYKVTFADGNTLTTSMNATLAEARAYYVGQSFLFGDPDGADKMVQAVAVEQLLTRCPNCETNGDHYCPADVATS